jgi:gluconolactonase
LLDARPFQGEGVKGGPDGLKVDAGGNIFATGPGGVFIFNASGKLLARIKIPEACSNVALTADGKTLFITADMHVLRIVMRK